MAAVTATGVQAGCTFKERAKGKGDEQKLQATVGGYPGNRITQDVELPGLFRQAIQKDHVENDPADGQKAMSFTVNGCGSRHVGGHSKTDHRN